MAEALADAGNSALKLLLPPGPPVQLTAADAWPAWLATHRPEAVRAVVSGPRWEPVLRAACVAAGIRLRVAGGELPLPDLGQYATCGADRVLAGLATCKATAGIVIDAGTATTITAWHAGPRFAGGMILPGAEACRRGLAAACPGLPSPELDWARTDPAQHDTRGAVQAALAIGYPGMVAACVDTLRRASGITRTVITGGGAAPLLGPDAEHHPHAVLEGLALL